MQGRARQGPMASPGQAHHQPCSSQSMPTLAFRSPRPHTLRGACTPARQQDPAQKPGPTPMCPFQVSTGPTV